MLCLLTVLNSLDGTNVYAGQARSAFLPPDRFVGDGNIVYRTCMFAPFAGDATTVGMEWLGCDSSVKNRTDQVSFDKRKRAFFTTEYMFFFPDSPVYLLQIWNRFG